MGDHQFFANLAGRGVPVKSAWFEMRRGPLHATSGRGKMACSANLPKAGPTTIEATLTFDVRPAVVSFKKADLVIKQ